MNISDNGFLMWKVPSLNVIFAHNNQNVKHFTFSSFQINFTYHKLPRIWIITNYLLHFGFNRFNTFNQFLNLINKLLSTFISNHLVAIRISKSSFKFLNFSHYKQIPAWTKKRNLMISANHFNNVVMKSLNS